MRVCGNALPSVAAAGRPPGGGHPGDLYRVSVERQPHQSGGDTHTLLAIFTVTGALCWATSVGWGLALGIAALRKGNRAKRERDDKRRHEQYWAVITRRIQEQVARGERAPQ